MRLLSLLIEHFYYWGCMSIVCSFYVPDVMVIQCGADSLSRDKFGHAKFIDKRLRETSEIHEIIWSANGLTERWRIYNIECC
jgi:hypothetical protein